MKIAITDIAFGIKGFHVESIKKLSDKQLTNIDNELTEIKTTSWVNMDDLGYLTVAWLHIGTLDNNQEIKVLNVLNKAIKRMK